MFPLVREAVASVLPVERLRFIAFSHVEADECGSLNEWLTAAPHSAPLCGTVAALVSISDFGKGGVIKVGSLLDFALYARYSQQPWLASFA